MEVVREFEENDWKVKKLSCSWIKTLTRKFFNEKVEKFVEIYLRISSLNIVAESNCIVWWERLRKLLIGIEIWDNFELLILVDVLLMSFTNKP